MINEQQSVIVKTLCRVLVPFIQMFGLYVIVHGHSSPGGGFQGGGILASSFILLALGDGIDGLMQRLSLGSLTILTSTGVLLYAGIGFVCLALGANYLDYSILPIAEPRSIGMLVIEVGVGFTVMAVMISIFHDLITFE